MSEKMEAVKMGLSPVRNLEAVEDEIIQVLIKHGSLYIEMPEIFENVHKKVQSTVIMQQSFDATLVQGAILQTTGTVDIDAIAEKISVRIKDSLQRRAIRA
jgi:hypothetical protein